jgi:hypothetical protein
MSRVVGGDPMPYLRGISSCEHGRAEALAETGGMHGSISQLLLASVVGLSGRNAGVEVLMRRASRSSRKSALTNALVPAP